MTSLASLKVPLEELIAAVAPQCRVPGYLAGVAQGGEQLLLAHGTANVATGAPMTTGTAWLLGSITKVLVATLVLRLVERGAVELDQPVVAYLPEFRLAEPGAAERITVRHLLDHSNGIDADTLMPPGDDVATYVAALAQRGMLFEPGAVVHYSNPGFCIAGRLVEVVTGLGFGDALQREVFAPAKMRGSAIADGVAPDGDVAFGTMPDAEGGVRPAPRFVLPATTGPAGATPLVTLADLLAFARGHLGRGDLLSGEHVRAMQIVSHDLGTPNVPPVGLGWWLCPYGGTTVAWHGGGSPGGSSSLAVVLEHDLAIVGYGNGPAAGTIHDAVIATVLGHLGSRVATPLTPGEPAAPYERYAGTYAGFQIRNHVTASPQGLTAAPELIPLDDHHAQLGVEWGIVGKQVPLRALGGNLFAPDGVPLELLAGICGRLNLVSFHGDDGHGHPEYLHHGLRLARREQP